MGFDCYMFVYCRFTMMTTGSQVESSVGYQAGRPTQTGRHWPRVDRSSGWYSIRDAARRRTRCTRDLGPCTSSSHVSLQRCQLVIFGDS